MFHMGTGGVGTYRLRLLHLLMLLDGVHIFIANEYVSEVEMDGINLIQMEQHCRCFVLFSLHPASKL